MFPSNLLELDEAARGKLPSAVHDYYAGGAHDELTLRENRAAYERRRLHYHVLRDVAQRELSTELLGSRLALPVVIAPTAFHRLAHEQGELATVRAAGAAGTVMILSTLATTSIEDVVTAATGPVWFQLYVYRDREATRSLVQRAEAAGCQAIVLTVDAQLWGVRERDVRNRFALPQGLAVENLVGQGKGALPPVDGSALAAYVAQLFDPALDFEDLEWLASSTRLPVLVKGVVRGDDALRAVDHGAAGVVVSNHGGRQLDTAPATLDVLEEVVQAVGGRAPVLVDGGVRRGTDVVKAIALGAAAVGIGRPVLWGLALGGEQGVGRVLAMLRAELDLALALCGATSVREVPRNLVRP
ncbi:MAG TPA: alpha-hydroxy acid oxidase [Thermoanaerobaculia bacterium]|nr:alpha-hydroxy acid oxidase [Thermoanaerobaculia bacterium]